MTELSPGAIAATGGLAGGMVLGVAARWGRFCTLAAIEDAIFSSSLDRLRMWALAMAVAIAATFAMDAAGIVDITASFYLSAPVGLVATLVGALMFGLGMALVGTCGYGMLARIGGGDLRSIVTFLVMGASAYATVRGATAFLRVWLFPMPEAPGAPQGAAHALAAATATPPLAWALIAAAAIAAWALSARSLRGSPRRLATALMVGLVVPWGWFVTGVLAPNEFEGYRLSSYTFSLPPGEALVYLMTMTGATLNFGIGAVAGVVAGAFLSAIRLGQFRWEACDDVVELRRQMVGGFLMGTGGVLALGCTIGQGLTAASLLAWSAPVALAGIFAGAWLGLNYLISGSMIEPLKAFLLNRQGDIG